MTPMRHAAVAVTMLWLAGTAAAQTAAQLLPARSEIVFTSRQMGVPVEGRFTRFDAQIAFDPKAPAAGSVQLGIDTASATLGLAETDAELVKAAWFGSAKFPRAIFQSSALKALGGGRFEITGKLNLKGSTHDLLVPVQITQAAGVSTVIGNFTIKRLDFRIGEAEWADTSIVADDVQVRFKLSLTGIAPL